MSFAQINIWLKTSPRAWFLRLPQALLKLGFTASAVDTSLFTFHSNVYFYAYIC